MKLKNILQALLLTALTIPGQLQAVALVGVYDENTIQSNTVNGSASFVSGVGGANASNVLAFATFVTNVEAAFIAGFGGVLDFETPTRTNDNVPGTGLAANTDLTFAAGAKSLSLGLSLNSGAVILHRSSVTTNRTAISGSNLLIHATEDGTPDTLSFTIGALTGGVANEGVSQFGFTFLSRASRDYGIVTASAVFSGGATVTSSFTNTIFTAGGQDTFFGFIAPTGQSISSVSITTQNPLNATTIGFSIDDIGIVTNVIPEPATGLLVISGLGALMIGRRRYAS